MPDCGHGVDAGGKDNGIGLVSVSTPRSMQPRKVIIDTDPGIDDALALILALGAEALDVRLITTVAGNVGLERCTANALRVLEAFGGPAPPPVHPGCDRPLSGRFSPRAEHVHGGDGFGGVAERYPVRRLEASRTDAVTAILSAVRENPGEAALIALGPLTNVASAIEVDAETMTQIEELIVMGGSFGSESNVTAAAEFNFFADPVAARVVIQSGLPVTAIGLNVTHRAALPRLRFEALLREIPSEAPARKFLADLTRQYFEVSRRRRGIDGAYLHDPLAVGAAIDPQLISVRRYPCDVEIEGDLTTGMMIVDTRPSAGGDGSNVKVATAVDAERFLTLFERTLRAAAGIGAQKV